jgi:DNA-binding NarL/FixJ family response regulator
MSSNKTTFIALIDDLPQVREAFNLHFLGTEKDNFTKCLIASPSIEEFLTTVKDWQPIKYLFLDIDLPGKSGLEALEEIKEKMPDTEVIMYTMFEDKSKLMLAFNLGASGYILKDATMEDVQEYINVLNEGGAALSPKMAKYMIAYIANTSKSTVLNLNPRETQVLKFLAEGWSYKMIAQKLKITEDGVGHYIRRIYKALNVHSKGEAIKIFYDNFGNEK